MQIYQFKKPSEEVKDFLQSHGYDEMNELQKKELIRQWYNINTNPEDTCCKENNTLTAENP